MYYIGWTRHFSCSLKFFFALTRRNDGVTLYYFHKKFYFLTVLYSMSKMSQCGYRKSQSLSRASFCDANDVTTWNEWSQNMIFITKQNHLCQQFEWQAVIIIKSLPKAITGQHMLWNGVNFVKYLGDFKHTESKLMPWRDEIQVIQCKIGPEHALNGHWICKSLKDL